MTAKHFSTKLTLLFVFSILAAVAPFSIKSQHKMVPPNTCTVPLITEYLFNYVLPLNDLRVIVEKNISSLNLNDIKQSSVAFSKIKATTSYIAGSQTHEQASPTQYHIFNDAFSINLAWHCTITRANPLYPDYQFDIVGIVDKVLVNFTKGYNKQTNAFYVNGTVYAFKPEDIVIKDYGKADAEQQKKILALARSSLFNSINQTFKSLDSWMGSNALKQRIGELFDTDQYVYDFYGWKVSIDTRTSYINSEDGNNIVNGYRGEISGLDIQFCPEQIQPFHANDTVFISFQFIQNLALSTVKYYKSYQNIPINSTWIRTSSFQFRLIDLQFVLGDALLMYPNYIMNPITFSCSLKQLVSGIPDETANTIHEILKWACTGDLVKQAGTSAKILDFEATINHEIEMRVLKGSISAYSNKLTIVDVLFNPVGDLEVKNVEVAKIYMREFFNDFRTYIPGTFFQVKSGSQSLKVQNDKNLGYGVWIG